MSVRAEQTGDRLSVTTFIGVSTGALTMTGSVKLLSDLNRFADLFAIGETVPITTNSTYAYASADATGTGLFVEDSLDPAGGPWFGTSSYAASINTWLHLALSRNGSGTLRLRVFADDVGLTKLADLTVADGSLNLSACVSILIGHCLGSATFPNAEFTNFKAVAGIELSDTECRTEHTTFGWQTAGGTKLGSWVLETINSDAYGILDTSGAGNDLTNAGFVNGASRPSQLEAIPSTTPFPLSLLLAG